MISSHSANDQKLYVSCGIPRPLTDFRFSSRKTGRRHSICNDCHREYMREHRAAKRRKKMDRDVRKVNSVANKYNHDFDRVASVLQTGFRSFGGLSGFCEEFVKHVKYSAQRGPTMLSLRAMMFMCHPVRAADRLRYAKQEEPWEKMSEEELRSLFWQLVPEKHNE